MRDYVGRLEHIARLALGGKLKANVATIHYAKCAEHYGAFDRILTIATGLLKEAGEPVIPSPYVVSIPGCATRFTRRITNASGACHLHGEYADFAFQSEPILVIPLRHPKSVWATWRSRGRDEKITEPFEWFWSELQVYAGLHEIYWLPVDHPRYRNEYFEKICTARGMTNPPPVDWSVRDGHDDPDKVDRGQAPEFDFSEILAYPCVRQFYNAEPPENVK